MTETLKEKVLLDTFVRGTHLDGDVIYSQEKYNKSIGLIALNALGSSGAIVIRSYKDAATEKHHCLVKFGNDSLANKHREDIARCYEHLCAVFGEHNVTLEVTFQKTQTWKPAKK